MGARSERFAGGPAAVEYKKSLGTFARATRSAKLSASADKASVRVQGEAIGGARWADATGHYDFIIPTAGLVDTDFIFGVARSGGR